MQGFKKKPWPVDKTDYWRSEVEAAFPEALVEPPSELEQAMTNHEKDRHVLAAAYHAKATAIVTFNLKDFPAASLERWGVHAVHPAAYLVTLYTIDSGVVVSKLMEIAEQKKITPPDLLKILMKTVPVFSQHVAEALNWTIPD